jgi:hypothetical protein
MVELADYQPARRTAALEEQLAVTNSAPPVLRRRKWREQCVYAAAKPSDTHTSPQRPKQKAAA